MKPSLKPLLLAALAGLLLSISSLVVWLLVNDTEADAAFGRVTEVATTTILLADRHGDITTVSVSSTTTLWRGKQQVGLDALTAGEFVQVVGERVDRAHVKGNSVYIMKAPPDADRPRGL